MKPVLSFLRDTCFWDYLDAGITPEETPLFLGRFEDLPLTDILCLRYGISVAEAEFEIEAARREVAL